MVVNGANVTARYIFGKPFSWAEELMLFLMILSVFAGAIAVTWRNLHIRIDTFIDLADAAHAAGRAGDRRARLHRGHPCHRVRGQRTSSTRCSMLDQRSDALDVPSWIPQSFLTIGLAVIALLIGVRTVQTLMRPSPPPRQGDGT